MLEEKTVDLVEEHFMLRKDMQIQIEDFKKKKRQEGFFVFIYFCF